MTAPVFLDDGAVAAALPWDALIGAVEDAVTHPDGASPTRTVHTVPVPGAADGAFLLKPAWIIGDVIALKAVTVYPDNGAQGLPTVQAGVLLFDAATGSLLGACAGNELTTRRTAAASAAAAKRLARPDARRLLVVGSGALAPMAAQAHAAVRDYERIEIWGRRADAAAAVVEELVAAGYPAVVAGELDAAVATADVISAVTGSREPLIRGDLLQPGAHVDLVGAFNAEMRESDDAVVVRGSLFVDTRDDAILAGDLAQPLASGVITTDAIQADLADLVRGTHPGRRSDDEITVFKSVGLALEDVAAAKLAFGER
ncbi:MAG: ornithine cyclodeaminase family protein [Acidimicrobiales bacterium]|nr:ornithine cyclodeaminase family protein [Acidimicrobiales bacterium]